MEGRHTGWVASAEGGGRTEGTEKLRCGLRMHCRWWQGLGCDRGKMPGSAGKLLGAEWSRDKAVGEAVGEGMSMDLPVLWEGRTANTALFLHLLPRKGQVIGCEIKLTIVTTSSIWGLFSFSSNGSNPGQVCAYLSFSLKTKFLNFLSKLYFFL